MIRVCHIVNLITGRTDGVYAHLKMIFENSDKTKFQHYLIFQGGENIEKELSDMGVKVFVSTSLKKKISIQAFIDIYGVLKNNNIDIVHAHLIKPYAISGLVNIVLRKKIIFNYHGIFLKNNPYYSLIEKIVYRSIHILIYSFSKVDAVLIPSRKSKELLMNETKLFPEPNVYYNGYSYRYNKQEANSDLMKKIQMVKSSNNILALVGRLEIDKRIDSAIEIVKRLNQKNKNVSLLIFGDGTLKDDLQNIVNQYELNQFIYFFGYVKGLQNYYKYFDIILFTSEWEGMPLSMWEAMANEVPVVAPDVGGFKEILEKNSCGLIYQQANLKVAEDKILYLMDDEQLRKEIGKNGRLAIESKYNEKNFANQIEQVYFDLLLK